MANYNPLNSLLDTVKGNLETLRVEAVLIYRGIYASSPDEPELPVPVFDDTGRPATEKEIPLYRPDLAERENQIVPDQGDDISSIFSGEKNSR